MNGQTQIRKLDGWKEIASYLGVAPRTAQEYERNLGLPVHRLPGQPRSRVAAFSDELDVWRAGPNQPVGGDPEKPLWSPVEALPPRRRLLKLVAGATVMACSIMAAALWWARAQKSENPVGFKVQGSLLTAFSRSNRPVWSYSLPDIPSDHPGYYRDMFVDLDGDGRSELLYVYWPPRSEDYEPVLYCLNTDGKVRWTWKPGKTVSTPLGRQYSGPFWCNLLGVLKRARADGGRIVVGSHHPISWPSQVVLLTAEGKVVSEYWHPGWLFSV